MTRTEEVMAAVRAKVKTRALGDGDKLPSVRRFAQTMQVSPSTVVEAYDRLAAEGLIRARRGSGFFVTGAHVPPLVLGELGPKCDRAVDPVWLSRQSLDANPAALMPGCGWLPADWMPTGLVRRALRDLTRSDDCLLTDYGGTRGAPGLRRVLLGRFAEEGLEVSPDHLMLTGSGTQAIDLICRFLLRPGDTVLVDDPCYFNFQTLLRAHQVRIIGVPFAQGGPDPSAFEALVSAEKPRLYVTNSALHNPTGASLSPQTAHRVLSIAAAHDVTIIEDDIFADFEPAPSPRLAVLDGFDRVIRIGSFSKTLSAALRCGYIAARPDWIEGLVDLQVATTFGGPSPVAVQVIEHVLAGGRYRKHMDELRARLSVARTQVTRQLAGIGIEPSVVPRGGFYLWCRLPDGQNATRIAERCRRDGVILAPGNVFSVSGTAGEFMRFNVAQSGDARVLDVLRAAMAEG